MSTGNIIAAKQREAENKRKLLEVNPYLEDKSGIYVFTRYDENGFKYAYIGQAQHVLTRLAEHLNGYNQHIDLSLRKHGLWGADKPYGWFVHATYCDESSLNEQEQLWIKRYAEQGFQLRNKTSGSQGKGKSGIADNKPAKGYYDGKKQGKSEVLKELRQVVKYLQITPKNEGKLANRMAQKFWEIVGTDSN